MLIATGLLPRSAPDMLFVAAVAFVSAVQVESFRRIGEFSYNSTYITGDLREAANGLYGMFAARTVAERHKAALQSRELGLVWVCFFAGAVLGAFSAWRLDEHGLWLAVPLLALALGIRLERRHRSQQS